MSVYITGWGIASPLGIGIPAQLRALQRGKTGAECFFLESP